MKTVFKSLILSTALLAAGAMAHGDRTPGATIIETLELDDARQAQVQEIMTHFHEQKTALRKAHREQMRALNQEQKTALEGVLTEEEMAQLGDEMKNRMKKSERFGKWREKRGGEME